MSVYGTWGRNEFLEKLEQLKSVSDLSGLDQVLDVGERVGEEKWGFSVKSYGRKGYEWLLDNNEYALSIGSWETVQSRPNVFIEIRSETLHHLGSAAAVERIVLLLSAMGLQITSVKVTRVDLYCDVLVREEVWGEHLHALAVTRAATWKPYYEHDRLTGITIGSGKVLCRLYDKPWEIANKSHKVWMYLVWKIVAVPEGHMIIRVEFQLRREAIKALGVDTWEDLQRTVENVWGYCTQEWLRFADNPEREHKYRETLPWWKVVQENFLGVVDACPAIRAEAYTENRRQLLTQFRGYLSSFVALEHESKGKRVPEYLDLHTACGWLDAALDEENVGKEALASEVARKTVKHQRKKEKYRQAVEERKRLGLTPGSDKEGAG